MAKLHVINSVHSLSGKTVVMRIDSDVDLKDGLPAGRQGKIVDDTRLESAVDTIYEIIKKGGQINLIGHLGRPEGEDKKYTLYPIALWFANRFHGEVQPIEIGKLSGWKITSEICLIENLRFFPEEEKNDPEFARELALLGDVYVDEAFAVSHRDHASISGITKYLPSYAGLHLAREVVELSEILQNPKRPLAVLIGGAKIETKLPMVEKMHHVADYVLVGGEIAEQDRVLIKVQHEKIQGQKSAVLVSESAEDGKDIDQKSVENFCQILGMAATIVWNGPVGLTDHGEKTEKGTKAIAEYIVSTNAYKVVGGGDTLAFLKRHKLLEKFDFVSTGGGAMLEFLSGKKLPGITALEAS